MDINSLNSKELAILISEANKRKKVLAKRKPINQVRAAVNRIVRGSGYTFDELFGSAGAAKAPRARKSASKSAPRKTVAKVAPKYRNPDNPSETWSGRGRQPLWLAAKVEKGAAVADFLIK